MELVYLWVKEYKNIHNQGFNFSPRFRCEYDHDSNELTIVENTEYVDIFPENINVTAIVGKNGSGKSSLVEKIINDIRYNKKLSYRQQKLYCYLSEDKKQIFIDSSLVSDEQITCKFPYKLTHINSSNNIQNYVSGSFFPQIKQLQSYNDEYDRSFFYFFGNNLEADDFLRPTYVYNEELLFYTEVNKYDGVINLEHEYGKIYGYLTNFFLNRSRIPEKLTKFWLPTKIFLNREVFVNLFSGGTKEEVAYRNFLKKSSIESILKLETVFFLRYVINTKKFHTDFYEYIYKLKNYFNDYSNIIDNLDNILSDIKPILQEIDIKIKSFKQSVRFDSNTSNDFYLKNLSELEKIVNLLINSATLIDLIQNINNYPEHDYELDVNKFDEENISILKQLPSYLSVDFASEKDIKFSKLSSGEQNILKLLFSIENIIHLRKDKTKSFNIFLDEIENTFHPDWQKRLIVWIVNFFKNYDNLQLNFIFTTHSPFLLSDIPKQNIIFLDTCNGKCKVLPHDKVMAKKQTFGQNIHTLLSDSFFMEDGLMGEFARSKIDDVIKFHKKVEEENKKDSSDLEELKREYSTKKDKFWQIQQIIGEDYLKQVIKNHLVEIEKILLGKDAAREEEIKRTEAYLEKLKSDKSN